jgi:hypothetical protein
MKRRYLYNERGRREMDGDGSAMEADVPSLFI